MDIVRFCYMEIFFMPVCTLTSSVWVPISNIWSNSQIFASRLDAKKKKKVFSCNSFIVNVSIILHWKPFMFFSYKNCLLMLFARISIVLIFFLSYKIKLISHFFFFFFWSVTLSETPFLLQDYLKKEILLEILSFFKLWNYSVFL